MCKCNILREVAETSKSLDDAVIEAQITDADMFSNVEKSEKDTNKMNLVNLEDTDEDRKI